MGPLTWWISFGIQTSFQDIHWVIAAFIILTAIFIFGMDFVLFIHLGFSIYEFFRILKYKIPRFRFREFPFFISGSIKGTLPDLPKKFNRMTITLRFIEETHDLQRRYYFLDFFQLYKETKIFEEPPLVWDGTLNVDWKLPDDPEWINCLSEQPSKYWELEVIAETSGVDYHSRFLLPVYARPN